jgi:hypothetical protein
MYATALPVAVRRSQGNGKGSASRDLTVTQPESTCRDKQQSGDRQQEDHWQRFAIAPLPRCRKMRDATGTRCDLPTRRKR